jgi:transposase
VRERTRLCNRIHRDLVVIRPGYERRIPRVLGKKNLASVMTMLRGDASVRAGLTRERIAEIRRIDRRVARLEAGIVAKLGEFGSNLLALRGIGALTAAKILGEVGDVSRLRSASSFARLAGSPTACFLRFHDSPPPQQGWQSTAERRPSTPSPSAGTATIRRRGPTSSAGERKASPSRKRCAA